MFAFVLHRILLLARPAGVAMCFFDAINSLFETDSVPPCSLSLFAILASVDEAAKKAHKNSEGRKPDRRLL